MSIIFTIAVIIILFGGSIFVHELGHFLAARLMGLTIDAFSIGMGPAVWQKEHKGVVYKIGCLPIGGYVALPQLDPELGNDADEEADGEDKGNSGRELPPISPWRKIPVQIAGVVGNVLLAFIIAVAIHYAVSSPASQPKGAVLGFVSTNSAAYDAGLRLGDRIQSVNGEEIGSWNEFVLECALAQTANLEVFASSGERKELQVRTEKIPQGGRIIDGIAKSTPCLVLNVQEGSSADRADIQQADVVTSFNNTPVMGVQHLIRLVDQHAGREVPIEILRDEKKLKLKVTPEYSEQYQRALIGVAFNPFDISRPPLEQLENWAMPVFRILQALMTPSEAKNAASSLGGPVSIVRMFWLAVQSSLLFALWFTGMININLAILNILPIPILDGGHLLFSIIEILSGKPINPQVMMFTYRVFLVLLITIIVLITFNDVRRIFVIGGDDKQDAPPATAETDKSGQSAVD